MENMLRVGVVTSTHGVRGEVKLIFSICFRFYMLDIQEHLSDYLSLPEATKKWLANGAQPTETVGKLLKIAGIQ